ncbi:MAG: glycosyltransferase family 87 protein [Acidobacteriaceae bacterium]
MAVCFAALIWLTGRYWTTRFFTPQWVLLVAVLWVRADPLRDAIELTQTHVIFVLLSVFAIILSRSNRPVWAGILLAVATAVKITPGVLVVYWLFTRQRKAALSFVLTSLALFTAPVLLTGPSAIVGYLHSMARVSNILLLAKGNQSMAAWWMGLLYPKNQPLTFQPLRLPATLKLVCSSLVVLSALFGAYFDRQREAPPGEPAVPYGAIFTLLGATVFTPIAWSHYYLILVIPLILMLDEYLRRRSYPLLCLFVFIIALSNSPNLLRHAGYLHLPVPDLVRGQFYAGLLAMAALYLLYRRQRDATCTHAHTARESG